MVVGFLERSGPAGTIGRSLAAIGGGIIALPTTEVININVGDITLLTVGSIMAVAGVMLSRGKDENSIRDTDPVAALD